MSATSLTATVILCTRNRLEPLLACLASLTSQTRPPEQIIIVDSSDQALTESDRFRDAFDATVFSAIELLYLRSAPGLTAQRNLGATRATGDIVFFFDDDVVVAPDYLVIMMADFGAHPEYGGGMGNIIGAGSRHRLGDIFRRLFMLNYANAAGRMQPSGWPTHAIGRQEFLRVEILSGALAAYRRQILQEYRFDEAVVGYGYMEDVDFSYRVSRRYPLFYEPRALVEHHHTPLARDRMVVNRRMYLVNHHYFFRKNIYPTCRWCLVPYLWSIIGLFLLAALSGRWEALRGYGQGIWQVLINRWHGRPVLHDIWQER